MRTRCDDLAALSGSGPVNAQQCFEFDGRRRDAPEPQDAAAPVGGIDVYADRWLPHHGHGRARVDPELQLADPTDDREFDWCLNSVGGFVIRVLH